MSATRRQSATAGAGGSENGAAGSGGSKGATAGSGGRKSAAGPGGRKAGTATAGSERPVAGFIPMETRPANAEIWPVHAITWLEPELRPGVPASSGLRIERRCRAAVPDFVRQSVDPATGPKGIEAAEATAGQPRQALPKSDLSPMGWDPRVEGRPAAPRKEDRK